MRQFSLTEVFTGRWIRMTCTVLIKHQRVTVLGKARSTQTSGSCCFGRELLPSVHLYIKVCDPLLCCIDIGNIWRTAENTLDLLSMQHVLKRSDFIIILFLNKLNKQTDLRGQHNFTLFILCLYVADPATFLDLNSLLGILFSSENSLFTHLWKR